MCTQYCVQVEVPATPSMSGVLHNPTGVYIYRPVASTMHIMPSPQASTTARGETTSMTRRSKNNLRNFSTCGWNCGGSVDDPSSHHASGSTVQSFGSSITCHHMQNRPFKLPVPQAKALTYEAVVRFVGFRSTHSRNLPPSSAERSTCSMDD